MLGECSTTEPPSHNSTLQKKACFCFRFRSKVGEFIEIEKQFLELGGIPREVHPPNILIF
jgi:hypothetical protein